MVITIDGTVGSGKSTAAAGLARRLGAVHLDTGAMYRALTLKALESGTDLEDAAALVALARASTIELTGDGGNLQVGLDGLDVTEAIRENRISVNAHHLARTPGVRAILVAQQREFAAQAGAVVADGRDQGTVAFPDADAKFFLDADPKVRARRRQLELEQRGQYRSYREVLDELLQRDHRDTTREAGPLRPAEGAVHVDTTHMTVDEMIDALEAEVRRRWKGEA